MQIQLDDHDWTEIQTSVDFLMKSDSVDKLEFTLGDELIGAKVKAYKVPPRMIRVDIEERRA
jgi:hypothetical protein